MNTVAPKGNLTIDDHEEVFAEIRKHIAGNDDLTIDLGGLQNIDSIAVAIFIEVIRRMQFNNRKAMFLNLPERFRLLLDLYEVGDHFELANGQ